MVGTKVFRVTVGTRGRKGSRAMSSVPRALLLLTRPLRHFQAR